MEGCIEWTGARIPNGYGMKRHHGRQVLVHRWAWEQANGPIPEGMYVLHHCDNPPCFNIEHLFLGTHADNMRDKMVKGRFQSKLGVEDVVVIRARSANGARHCDLAREYGVSQSHVLNIVHRIKWKHVP